MSSSCHRCQASRPIPLDDRVGDHGVHAQRLAGKADAQGVAHEAAAAVRTDEEPGAHRLFASRRRDADGDAEIVGLEGDELAAEFDGPAQLGQPPAQDALGEELRHHQGQVAGLAGGVCRRLDDPRLLVTAIAPVFALLRIFSAHRDQPVEHAEIFQHFLAARLDALAARTVERRGKLVDQPERHAAPAKLDGERQAGGTGTDDKDIDVTAVFHEASFRV